MVGAKQGMIKRVGSDSGAVHNMICEISAELRREKQRNSELIRRISLLESQLQPQRIDHLQSRSNEQGSSPNAMGRRFKKFKKQTDADCTGKVKDIMVNSQTLGVQQNLDLRNGTINWLNMDDHHFSDLEKPKHADSLLESEDNSDGSDDLNDQDFSGNGIAHKDVEDDKPDSDSQCMDTSCIEKERINMKISMQIKSQKMPFSSKEVTRILELKELLLKNAQSHTIRKIIVFALLGIKHGCEDMYELDFNHFKVLRKGDPYESPQNPGEHVVYDKPGVRKKIFYPNRQNPTLCPIRILEEEKAMRPSGDNCPSCLFLCIKYGGSTRNLPQQEYVRQRMGRNKLKSFGPSICRMAMLTHIRSGCFFFKALGISLLFMAGFSGDKIRMQTKYKNLHLQKYYRTDKDTEGNRLFLSHPSTWLGLATCSSQRQTVNPKTSKKQKSSLPGPDDCTPSTSSPSTQFGPVDFPSSQTRAFRYMINQTPTGPPNFFNPNQSSNPIFQPHLANSYMPMMYWPPPNTLLPPLTYQSLPSSGNYISVPPQPLFIHVSSNSVEPNMVNCAVKNGPELKKNDGDSSSSSSNTQPKES